MALQHHSADHRPFRRCARSDKRRKTVHRTFASTFLALHQNGIESELEACCPSVEMATDVLQPIELMVWIADMLMQDKFGGIVVVINGPVCRLSTVRVDPEVKTSSYMVLRSSAGKSKTKQQV